ncbi:MAG: trehalose-phosphatase [Candidatus Delongbacteria bacterium]|jgi:trehalose 6-phosphate phosphatase|nr:trehalose-phosphatase [Candidatus Delongbacteria bacterium]
MQMLNLPKFKAAILDMDGVITQTARLHAKAWKLMFDDFLQETQGKHFEPLSIERDYKKYIDGVPRFDGVRRFLKSRQIEVPEGSESDSPEEETIYGLGMRKNELFLDILKKEGAHVYPDTLEMMQIWKKAGIKLAVISASRNCEYVIKSAGLENYFDAKVDGVIAKQENLKGKPEPDVFIRAAEMLDVNPEHAIIVEDAISGVKAGKKGNFGLVAGIARNDENEALLTAGADVVVNKLTDMKTMMNTLKFTYPEKLPHALDNADRVFLLMNQKKPVLFLDYDGTLTPIVNNPDDALLSDEARQVLSELSDLITVAVITGRDREDIISKMQINSLIYAGSHGFDITGPDNLEMQYDKGKQALPLLDEAGKILTQKLNGIRGAQVERKKYAIAVHYRNVADDKVPAVKEAFYETLKKYDNLKEGAGKKVLELKPDIEWHKGYALNWLMDKLNLNIQEYLPVFIGDDVTDEDAFAVLQGSGLGIITGTHGQKTAASYKLNDTDEVIQFLNALKNHIRT